MSIQVNYNEIISNLKLITDLVPQDIFNTF